MKRKVARIGSSTLMVSLPAKWARANHIQKGDELEITEEGRRLVVGGDKEKEPQKATIDVNSPNEFVKRLLCVPYILGYDEIKVNFKDKEVFQKIEATKSILLGFEIIKQGENYCVLKHVAKGIEEQFETMYKRLIYVAESMGKELYSAMKKKELKRIENIQSMEILADRLDHFCRRILITQKYNDPQSLISYHRVRILESITDDYAYICQYVLDNNVKINKKTIKIMGEINKHFDYFKDILFNNKKKELANFKRKTKLIAYEITNNFRIHGNTCLPSKLFSIAEKMELVLQDSVA